jgi:UDP-N-acetylglucosamine kinase
MRNLDRAAWRIYARRHPVADPAAPKYLLPPLEGRRIFREEIVPDLLTGPEPQDEPVIVFVVGQQGAGKSRIAEMVGRALDRRGGFVELDSDLYKPYHPAYHALMQGDDKLMAAYLGPDSWAWLAQAHDHVRSARLNAVKHETAQDSRGAAVHLRAYRDAGFRIEAMFLAVPAAMSNQGVLSRYAEQVADRGHGRLTVQANADRAYAGVLDLADVIDREHLAEYAGVFRRGEAVPRYQISDHLRASVPLREAIDRERERPWTPEETSDFLRTHRKLRAQLSVQWTTRLDEILERAMPHMNRQAEPRPHWDITRMALESDAEPEAEM